jgi:hypothetical protein
LSVLGGIVFSEPRTNVIESSDGFSVEVLQGGRMRAVRYSEGGHTLQIPAELMAGPSGLALYPDSVLRWESPSDDESINNANKERILNNIKEAFRFKGLDISVS